VWMQKFTMGGTRPYDPSMALFEERSQSPAIVTQLRLETKTSQLDVQQNLIYSRSTATATAHATKNNIPKHHQNHKQRGRYEIRARQRVLDVGIFFLAAQCRQADHARQSHGEQTESRKSVAGHYAGGDEESEGRDHS